MKREPNEEQSLTFCSFLSLPKVVLSALIVCGTAAPSVNLSPDQYAYAGPVATYAAAAPVLVQEYQHVPAVAKVAEVVEHIPSSVSHHSSAVVHSSAAVATPVITPVAKATIVSAPAPVLHAAPVVPAPVRTIVEATPIVEEIREAQYVAPIVKQVALQPQAYAKVAEYVEHVPSSVSHHSSSVVHSSAAVATPVIAPVAKATIVQAAPVIAPVAKATIVSQPAPVLRAAPVFNEVAHDIVEIRPEVQAVPAAYAKVAEFVEHVPSSVSHHSSSVVHNTAAVATPVITPVAKTVVATAPVYKSAPLLKAVPAPAAYAVHEAPLYNSLPYAAYNYGPAYYNEPVLRSW